MKHVVVAALLLTLAVPARAGTAATPAPAPPAVATEAPGDARRKVDVNRATLVELVAVPGIGERLGQAIIELREKKGSFTNLDELLEVRGIGEKNLVLFAEHIAVVPVSSQSATGKISAAK